MDDNGHHGSISRNHFRRLLSSLQLISPHFPTDDDFTFLAESFPLDKVDGLLIDYTKFYDALNVSSFRGTHEVAAVLKQIDSHDTETFNSPPQPPPRPLQAIQELLGAFCKTHRVALTGFFKDYDHSHIGIILRSNFIRALSSAVIGTNGVGMVNSRIQVSSLGGLQFSIEELESVADAYLILPSEDSTWIGCCRWKLFINDIDRAAMNPNSPQPSPAHHSAPFIFGVPLQAAKKILRLIRQKLSQLRPLFHEHDKLSTGVITKERFRKCLVLLKVTAASMPHRTGVNELLLEEQEVESLCLFLKEAEYNQESNDSNFPIVYGRFIRILEELEGHSEEPQPFVSAADDTAAHLKTLSIGSSCTLESEVDVAGMLERLKNKVS